MTSISRRARTPLMAVSLCLAAGQACAQCGNPALYEFGGGPTAVCAATFGSQILYEAVGRGRFVSIESSPLISGSPTVVSRIGLDHHVIALATEIVGRTWASDGQTLYALDTSNPASPQLLGRITLPAFSSSPRLRVRGNYVYFTDLSRVLIIDATNPAAPVLRSIFTPSPSALVQDIEVVGSYAYLSIYESPSSPNSISVVDISSPVGPFEVRRVGSGGRYGIRLSKAPNLGGLYALSSNSSAAAIELWSLANPASPTLAAVNTTLNRLDVSSSNGFKATNTAVCYLEEFPGVFRRFDTSTLQLIGQPITLPVNDEPTAMGSDPPYIFITRRTGELARLNISANPPVLQDPYLDVVPGVTRTVAASGGGFSVLSGDADLWFFATPSGVAPFSFAHLKPDVGYDFYPYLTELSGTVFAAEYPIATGAISRILAYHVQGGTSPSVTFLGYYDAPGGMEALTAGSDSANGLRVFYTLPGVGTGPSSLHVLSASNPAAMTHIGSLSLTGGVSAPLRFLLPTFTGPPRVLIGGPLGSTQIVSVASSSPSPLGVIPSSSSAIVPGLSPTVWLLDQNILKAFDLSTPALPALESATRVTSSSLEDPAVDLKTIGTFGTFIAITTSAGDLVKVNSSSPSSPSILQIANINSGFTSPIALALAYDGTNLHIANGNRGYTVLPFNFDAPPREDPSHPLALLGPRGIVPICPGSPLVIPAHFVASPAPTSFQWFKLDRATNSYLPLPDGPTPTGSVVSGATTATITITGAAAGDTGSYSCQATNSCGSAMTDTTVYARLGGYANCDSSTISPVLNVSDFICFLTAFANTDPNFFFGGYPNCDGSTLPPFNNVSDFICFQQQYAAGCP